MDDQEAERIGLTLIEILRLKRKKNNGLVDTAWGNKTPVGLAKTVEHIMGEHCAELLNVAQGFLKRKQTIGELRATVKKFIK